MLGVEVVDVTEQVDRTVRPAAALDGDAADNTVALRGRVSSAPLQRELPSGAVISTFRVSVPRARTPMTAGSSQRSDWMDCVAWSARTRRAVATWQVGDEVELEGPPARPDHQD